MYWLETFEDVLGRPGEPRGLAQLATEFDSATGEFLQRVLASGPEMTDLPVAGIRRRRMTLFDRDGKPETWLYELSLSVPDAGALHARLFYLTTGNDLWSLNGTRQPIIAAVDKLGWRARTEEQAVEFLKFFCAFVGGDDGQPFCIVTRPEQMHAAPSVWGAQLEQRTQEAVSRSEELGDTAEELKKIVLQNQPKAFLKKSEVSGPGPDGSPDKPVSEGSSYGVNCLILYGEYLFLVEMEVGTEPPHADAPVGATPTLIVKMLADQPLKSQSASFTFVRYEFRQLVNNVPAMLTETLPQAGREGGDTLMTNKEFWEEVERKALHRYTQAEREASYIRNVVVRGGGAVRPPPVTVAGGVETPGARLESAAWPHPVRCKNVKFVDDVDFDDMRFSGSVRFENCEFMGTFSARNTRVGGTLSLLRSTIHGLPKLRGGPVGQARSEQARNKNTNDEGARTSGHRNHSPAVLDCDGIRVEGDLDCTRARVRGSAFIAGANVLGRGIFRGAKFYPMFVERQDDKGKKTPAPPTAGVNSPVLDVPPPHRNQLLLTLADSQFVGSLDLSAEETGAGLQEQRLDPTIVVGQVDARLIHVDGTVELSGLIVTSLKDADNNPLRSVSNTPSILLDNAEITGDLSAFPKVFLRKQVGLPEDAEDGQPSEPRIDYFWLGSQTIVRNKLSLAKAHIVGSIHLPGVHIGDDIVGWSMSAEFLDLRLFPDLRWTIPRPDDSTLNAEDQELLRSIDLPPVPDALSDARSFVGGDIHMLAASIRQVLISGCVVDGVINLRDTQVDQLALISAIDFEAAPENAKTDQDPGASRSVRSFGQAALPIRPTISHVQAGSLLLDNAVVRLNAVLSGVRVKVKNQGDMEIPGALSARGCRVGGHLRFFDRAMPRDLRRVALRNAENGRPHYRRMILEGRSVSDLLHSDKVRPSIEGDLNFKFSRIEGEVDLTNAEVGGKIRFGNSRIGANLKCHARAGKLPNNSFVAASTNCDAFEFDFLDCGGDGQIAGLHIRDGEKDSLGLTGRCAIFAGSLELVDDLAPAGHMLLANRRADLAAIKVRDLKCSARSFAQGKCLKLEDARIFRFQLVDPDLAGAKRRSAKEHGPFMMRNATVEVWRLSDDADENCRNTIRFLEQAVADSDPGLFSGLEQFEIARGRMRTANKVYRAMRKLIAPKIGRDFIGSIGDQVQRHLLGYGTALWRPFAIWLTAALFVLAVASSPGNYEWTGDKDVPPPFTVETAWWSAFSAVVPVVRLVEGGNADDWLPRTSGMTDLPFGISSCQQTTEEAPAPCLALPLSPDTWWRITSILSWILLPLMLAGLVGMIRRKV